jgi:hypothetical protein
MDSEISDKEFELMVDQEHFERVWEIINTNINDYVVSYLDEIIQSNENSLKPQATLSLYIKNIINEHCKVQDKYSAIFDPELMEEYEEDVDGFKGSILKHQCQVIQRTLNSRSEALKDWKIAFKLATPQQLYDTFYNMISFAEDYDADIREEELKDIDTIEAIKFAQMSEDACYLIGVIGTGILSTILNAIYPRIFPGRFKIGMFALYMISGKKPIDMGSNSSEFLMVKDTIKSKTGTIEQEHNYYFPYETFALYSLRIYRFLDQIIYKKYNIKFPDDYRYVLVNDFYEYMINSNKTIIQTLLGNDDKYKFELPM